MDALCQRAQGGVKDGRSPPLRGATAGSVPDDAEQAGMCRSTSRSVRALRSGWRAPTWIFYPGMEVLPPFAIYQADHQTGEQWPSVADAFRARLDGLFTDDPIPFRRQNGGHYDAQQMLKPGLGCGALRHAYPPGQAGRAEQLPVEQIVETGEPSRTRHGPEAE